MNRVRNGQNCYQQTVSCFNVKQTHRWHAEDGRTRQERTDAADVKHVYRNCMWSGILKLCGHETHALRRTTEFVKQIPPADDISPISDIHKWKPSTGHVTLTTVPLILTHDLKSHLNPVKSTVPQDGALQLLTTVHITSVNVAAVWHLISNIQ